MPDIVTEKVKTFHDFHRASMLIPANHPRRLEALKRALNLAETVTECLYIHRDALDGSYLKVQALRKALAIEEGQLRNV